MREEKIIAREIVKQLEALLGQYSCQWINEGKLLQEFPFTKRQLEKWRNEALIRMGYHYKSLSNKDEKLCRDGSRKKSYIYHKSRMIKFIDEL